MTLAKTSHASNYDAGLGKTNSDCNHKSCLIVVLE